MILTLYPNDFWRKIKMDNYDPYNVLLIIVTNIPVTAFVLQGHIWATKAWCIKYDTKDKTKKTFV